MYRSYVVEVECTFKIYKIVTLVKIKFYIYVFQVSWEMDGIFRVVLYYDAGDVYKM